MNKKIIIGALGVVFLAIIVSELAVYKYFSRSAKTEIRLDVPTKAEEDNVAAEKSADAEEKQAADLPKEEVVPEKAPAEKKIDPTSVAKTEEKSDGKIINKLVNFGFQKASGRKIDTVIIHSSYNALGGDPFSFSKILDIYKSYGVAPHYVIDRSGVVYRLVEDKNIAYHAGVSETPDGRKNVNEFSLGIEIANSKTEGPTDKQYSALRNLLTGLKGQYKIKYVLGHADIAPGRKDDPWKFDWKRTK